jgi:NitT/TauT family transport system substrate-binding protein
MQRTCLRIFALATVAALIALASPLRAQSVDDVVLRLNAIGYGEHAPFTIGVEKGFFAEERIKLTLREGQGSGRTVQVVASRTDPIGYADTATTMKAIATGVPLRTVAVFQQVSPVAIIFLEEKGFKTPKDLLSASIALTAGDSIHQMIPAFFKKNGLDPAQAKLLFMDTAAKSTAVATGKADAMGGFYTTQAGQIAAIAKKKTGWVKFADFGVNTLTQGIIVHRDLLKENPDLVRRFLRAAQKSWMYAEQNPEEAARSLVKAFPASAFLAVPEQGLQQWMYHRDLMRTPRTKGRAPGVWSNEDAQETIDLLAEYAGLAPKGKIDDYLAAGFLPQ